MDLSAHRPTERSRPGPRSGTESLAPGRSGVPGSGAIARTSPKVTEFGLPATARHFAGDNSTVTLPLTFRGPTARAFGLYAQKSNLRQNPWK